MKTKKVLLLCDFFSSLGGTEYYNFILAKSLIERNISVRVYIGERPKHSYWLNELDALNVEYHFPEQYTEDRNDMVLIENYVKSIKDQIQSWSPDIIHANPPGKMLISFYKNQVCNGSPMVVTEWTMPSENTSYWYPDELKKYINKVNLMIATCNKLITGIRQYHNYSGRVEVIPHLISPPDNSIVNNNSCGIHSVGCISRLSQEKGLVFLLGAWEHVIKDFPDATLHIYGHGEEKEYLEELSKALGISKNVFFEGVFSPVSGIDNIASNHQIFVQPSLFESIPTSIIELMGRGRIILATDVGGVSELIDNNQKSGVLIKRASTDDIYFAIKKLFNNIELQRVIQNNAVKKFKDNYDLNKAIDKLTNLYDSLI